tara:strand:+ start:55 stop:654 length:600 start_codon:yes stop_codon:yes gene_type:complete
MKKCSKCKEVKSLDEFTINRKNKKDGKQGYCKKCSKEQKKKYYQDTKTQRNITRKIYREENKEKVKATRKIYRGENKEQINRQKKKRYHSDPEYKLRSIVTSSINNILKGGKGGESILPYVDWSSHKELKEHIESQWQEGMTWDNHARDGWHIDHIIPQSVLLDGVVSMEHPNFRKCWALENLQPLWAKDNLSKGNKIL